MRKPLWLHRPLLNWTDLYRWAIEQGIYALIQPNQLHVTLATARGRVSWDLIGDLQTDLVEIPEGPKQIKQYGKDAWGLSFEHPQLTSRAEMLAGIMSIDYPDCFQAHLTLVRGRFVIPTLPYTEKLIFGPEIAEPFRAGMTMPRGNPINRNKFRTAIGLDPHDDDVIVEREFITRKAIRDIDR